jgi:hypothetical protein
MVLEIKHDELNELLDCYYNTKIPLFVVGTFGIGKSQVIREKSVELAKSKNKEFINWNEVSLDKKIEVYNNASKYFCFVDIRLSEWDSSDIKGLPELQASDKLKEWLNWRVPFFAKLLENPKSDGILFFDEINLATPLVQASCYKIIHDRIINDGKVAEDWLIVGAGNTDEDHAHTFELSSPLLDRAGQVKLMVPETQKWIDKYAIPRGINPLIIGFLSFKTGSLHKVDFNDKQKFTTPRGWERISKLIEANPIGKDYNRLGLLSKSAIGEGIASEFLAFCKINEQIKLSEIIANPKKIKDIKEINIKWFINTALAEQWKDKKLKFEKIVEFSKIMDENGDVELVAYLWKLCSGLNKKMFKADFIEKIDQEDPMVGKYAKFIC